MRWNRPSVWAMTWLAAGAIVACVSVTAYCISGYDEEIARINGEEVSLDRDLRQIEARLDKGLIIPEYYRQQAYWRLRMRLGKEQRETLLLEKEMLSLQRSGKAVPAQVSARLNLLKEQAQAPRLSGRQADIARASWDNIEDDLTRVAPDYGWHIVKINLLRDLIHRTRRIRFYLQEAMRNTEGGYGTLSLPQDEVARRLEKLLVKADPGVVELGRVYGTEHDNYRNKSPLENRLEQLTFGTRRWLAEYGECFFGVREQRLLGEAEQAAGLAARSNRLVDKLAELDHQREELTADTLAFLDRFDKDGKFDSLGIPYRREVTIGPDGRTSDLLFCTMSLSHKGHGPSRQLEDPLCFDVADFLFWGTELEGVGKVKIDERVQRRLQQAARDAELGYYLKQTILLRAKDIIRWTDPRFLPEDEQDDKYLYLTNADGKQDRYTNIWHPAIRDLLRQNMPALARFCKTIPNFLMYDKLTWEPPALHVTYAEGPDSRAVEAGYSPQAIAAFRDYLAEKFGPIDRLNEAWRSDYGQFSQIEPPPGPFVVQRRRATPLSHEFELFRNYSWADYLAEATELIQSEDPDHPVAAEIHTLSASFPRGAVLSFQLMQRVPVQFVEDHYNHWSAHYTALQMVYDLCRYAGKQPVEMEYIWTYPRLESPVGEEEFRVTGELSVWRSMVWGRQMLHVFGMYDGWGYQHNYMDEAYSCALGPELGPTGVLVREAGTAIPVGKKRAREFWRYLDGTEVVKPKIALVVPGTSLVNEYPYHHPHDALSTINAELVRFERFLTPRDMDCRFVPEEVIVSSEEDLVGFNVIMLPYTPYFPDGLAEKVLRWVQAGGTLISSGVPGVYDAHGFDRPELMDAVFGSQVRYEYSGDDDVWRWRLTLTDQPGSAAASELVGGSEGPLMIGKEYGQGRVILTAHSCFATPHHRQLQAKLADVLEQAIGWPTAASDHHAFEMVTRQGENGERYLFITNPSLTDTVMDYVTVDGEVSSVIDLGIGSHCKVALAPREPIMVNSRYDCTSRHSDGTTFVTVASLPGRTTFQMRLAPGEATVLRFDR